MGSSWSTECLAHRTEIRLGLCSVPFPPRLHGASGWRALFRFVRELPLTRVSASRASSHLPSQPPHYDSAVTAGDMTCFAHDYVPCYWSSMWHKANVSKNCEKTGKLIPINRATTILGIPSKSSKHAECHHNSEKNQSIEKCPEIRDVAICKKGLQNSYYKCAEGFNKTHSHNEQRNGNYKEKAND